ncbi:hypothetical protein SDC9_55746 [bioreactor metagenome]|uniref:Uncharacterized protein n=1 Tax=bioreactor metagenome TaxID=1076179 RepID=A0A644X006_9ZZZZ
MRLEDVLKDVSITSQRIIDTNCFTGDRTVLEGLENIKYKINEVIDAINSGIIKGDKGDKGDTGDKGDKGDKGDTGKASETIEDSVTDLDHTWSSQKINEFVDNKFNSLEDVQGVKYSTDKSYLLMNGTKNGVVKDLKMYGKSLVNLGTKRKLTSISSETSLVGDLMPLNKQIPNGTKVTVIGTVTSDSNAKECILAFYDSKGSGKGGILTENITPYIGKRIARTTTILNENGDVAKFGLYTRPQTPSETKFSFDDIVILEGDYIQNPPSYFEGIVSVGNGNEIEVLSRKEDGNLFDGILELGKILTSNGTDYSDLNTIRSKNKIFLKIGTYYLNGKGSKPGNFFKYDINGNYLGWGVISSSNGVFSIDVDCFVRFQVVETNLIDLNLSINKTITSYTPLEIDKKTILFKDVDNTWKPILNLRGIDENNCDIIDSVNNNFENKVGLTVLNGTETKWLTRNQPTDTNLFRIGLNLDGRYKKGSSLICDKFINEKESYEKEGISIHSADGNLDIVINKSKASSVETIKQYLQTNNISFIGILSEPKQYEINPIFPESYDNETMISFNTGVISGKKEFYIDSNLGSLVLENINRISSLEDQVYKVNTELLRGDMRLVAETYYPEDFKKEVLPNE